MRFVERLPVGTYDITETRRSGYNVTEKESRNWYLAQGGYYTWGKGKATVSCIDGNMLYRLEFTYKTEDMYDWHPGSWANVGIPVADDVLHRLHETGMAREYLLVGSFTKTITWYEGSRTRALDRLMESHMSETVFTNENPNVVVGPINY